MTRKEARERESRDAGRQKSWLFSALQAQVVPSISPHVHSKQAGQATVSASERKRAEETARGTRETCRQTELLLSDGPL